MRLKHRLALALCALALCGCAALPVPNVAPTVAPAAPTVAPARTATPAPSPVAIAPAPDVASYVIDATLDPAGKTVRGSETIIYTNPSNDTLREVWLRLYLRAFSSTDTLWMRESGGEHRGNAMSPEHLGDITLSSLTAGGVDLLAGSTLTDTLLRVPLAQPLAPGRHLELKASWTSKLPRAFARTGYGGANDTFFMVGQWYPKMAVYDRGRWDTEPWHAYAEFFADFGRYDVTVRVPRGYVVAACGVPAAPPQQEDDTTVARFTSTNVTDFAFAASPDFQSRSAQAGPVAVELFYLPEHAHAVDEYLRAATGSIQTFSAWYGPYPHPRLTVVDVPDDARGAGGMEYPTLITGWDASTPAGSGYVSAVTAHEIGHQWWPMQTATNEGREPWLDEGLTEYSGMRYLAEAGQKFGVGADAIDAETVVRENYHDVPNGPIDQPAWTYDPDRYWGLVYRKTAAGLWTLERVVGTERFRKAMAAYLNAYRFKHPTGADFRASIEGVLGPQPWFFDDYARDGATIDYAAGPIADASGRSRVIVTRLGGVRVPVEVRLTLASGAQQTHTLDGQARTVALDGPPGDRISRVEIDPEHKLLAEAQVDNNTQPVPEAVKR